MAGNLDDLLANWLSSVIDAKRANFRRGDEEVARDGVNPDGAADFTLRLLKLHPVRLLLRPEEVNLPI